jgi:hypothetical protein
MKTYKIAVEWTMIADIEVEANSLDEAIEKVEEMDSLPDNGEYLEDSFQVDEYLSEELNPN